MRVVLAVLIVAPSSLPLTFAQSARSIALALAGLALFATLAYALGRRIIVVDDRGFTLRGWLGVRHVPWREIEHYTYDTGIAKTRWNWWTTALSDWLFDNVIRFFQRRRRAALTLHLLSSETFWIDGDAHRLVDALDLVMDRLHAHLGARASFQPYELEGGELRGPAGAVSVLAITRVEITNRVTFFISTGESTGDSDEEDDEPWGQRALEDIRNGDLFLLQLAERGLPVEIDHTVTLPSKVSDAIAAAAARQRAMPKAKVLSRSS